MLDKAEVMATVAVRNLAAARGFYEGKLGLQPQQPAEESMVAYRCGGATLLVYESAFAGSNRANAATWNVASGLEEVVRSLKAKGVPFDQYDTPGMERQGDIHHGGGRKVAWCKDPDGNILCLAQG